MYKLAWFHYYSVLTGNHKDSTLEYNKLISCSQHLSRMSWRGLGSRQSLRAPAVVYVTTLIMHPLQHRVFVAAEEQRLKLYMGFILPLPINYIYHFPLTTCCPELVTGPCLITNKWKVKSSHVSRRKELHMGKQHFLPIIHLVRLPSRVIMNW